jgi:transcriptional regulator with XRE-family HTH domain
MRNIEITVAEKMRLIMKRLNINMTELSEKSGQSRQNLSNKFSRNNFTENDIKNLAEAMGCSVDIRFTLPDGTEI